MVVLPSYLSLQGTLLMPYLSLRDRREACRFSWQNGFAERLIGSNCVEDRAKMVFARQQGFFNQLLIVDIEHHDA